MIPFSTLRKIYRIPLINENKEAVHILSNLFQLLIALFRIRRRRDFRILHNIYFKMIESFAQYGREEAKDTVDLILQIPWFYTRQRDFYRAIVSYNRIIEIMKVVEKRGQCIALQEEINHNTREFIKAFKILINFNENDQARIDRLIERPYSVDLALKEIFETLGNKAVRLNHINNAEPIELSSSVI